MCASPRWQAAALLLMGLVGRSSGLVGDDMAQNLYSHAQAKFAALHQAQAAMQQHRTESGGFGDRAPGHVPRHLLADDVAESPMGRSVLSGDYNLGSMFGNDVSTCEGLEAEMTAHVAECQSTFVTPPCVTMVTAPELCMSNCLLRAWRIYDALLLASQKCAPTVSAVADSPLLPDSALISRPCAANSDCCGDDLCVNRTCLMPMCVKEVGVAEGLDNERLACQQKWKAERFPTSLHNREALTYYNVMCMRSDSSNTMCRWSLDELIKLGKDYSCTQVAGLECCLPSYSDFLSKCADSGIWPALFNATQLETITHVRETCKDSIWNEHMTCSSYRVQPRALDGKCHVVLSEMSGASLVAGSALALAAAVGLVALLH